MSRPILKNAAAVIGVFLAVWLGGRYILPILLPFALGTVLALAAEPLVTLLSRTKRLPRALCSGFGVGVTLMLAVTVVVFLGALTVKEVGTLAGALPDLERTARQGLDSLEGYLLDLSDRAPEGVRSLLHQGVENVFSDGSALVSQVAGQIPAAATVLFSKVTHSALTVGTGILAGFMISIRLPRIRAWLDARPEDGWYRRWLPRLKNVRRALWGWLTAQLKLSAISFAIALAGFLLLRVPYAPAWAALTAVVDAIPLLGTGAVLLPWSLVSLLQGNRLRALGLLCTYVAAALTRSTLEPRLVGRHLGLDPLMTLVGLYAGFRLWGFWGMLVAPVLCVIAREIAGHGRKQEPLTGDF